MRNYIKKVFRKFFPDLPYARCEGCYALREKTDLYRDGALWFCRDGDGENLECATEYQRTHAW